MMETRREKLNEEISFMELRESERDRTVRVYKFGWSVAIWFSFAQKCDPAHLFPSPSGCNFCPPYIRHPRGRRADWLSEVSDSRLVHMLDVVKFHNIFLLSTDQVVSLCRWTLTVLNFRPRPRPRPRPRAAGRAAALSSLL